MLPVMKSLNLLFFLATLLACCGFFGCASPEKHPVYHDPQIIELYSRKAIETYTLPEEYTQTSDSDAYHGGYFSAVDDYSHGRIGNLVRPPEKYRSSYQAWIDGYNAAVRAFHGTSKITTTNDFSHGH
jgi:hypothetical protein